jgi:hypothetical protein
MKREVFWLDVTGGPNLEWISNQRKIIHIISIQSQENFEGRKIQLVHWSSEPDYM